MAMLGTLVSLVMALLAGAAGYFAGSIAWSALWLFLAVMIPFVPGWMITLSPLVGVMAGLGAASWAWDLR